MHLNYIVTLYEEHLEISLGLIHRIDLETRILVKKAAEMCTTIPNLKVNPVYIAVAKDSIVLPTNNENVYVQIDLIEDLVPA